MKMVRHSWSEGASIACISKDRSPNRDRAVDNTTEAMVKRRCGDPTVTKQRWSHASTSLESPNACEECLDDARIHNKNRRAIHTVP